MVITKDQKPKFKLILAMPLNDDELNEMEEFRLESNS